MYLCVRDVCVCMHVCVVVVIVVVVLVVVVVVAAAAEYLYGTIKTKATMCPVNTQTNGFLAAAEM